VSEDSTDRRLEGLVREVLERPDEFALLCDLDGTLAPIVERPEQVEIPLATLAALDGAARKIGLCAVVTGRPAAEARRLTGLDTVLYAGNHGLELLEPGEEVAVPDPLLAGHEDDAHAFLATLDVGKMEVLGIRSEDKGPIVALHWRGSERTEALNEWIEQVGDDARTAGLQPRSGRMVLELRPDVAVDKGVAVKGMLTARPEIESAIFIGDDLTDLDAFEALDGLVASQKLGSATKVAVLSAETSDLGLGEHADLRLSGPLEVADLSARIGG